MFDWPLACGDDGFLAYTDTGDDLENTPGQGENTEEYGKIKSRGAGVKQEDDAGDNKESAGNTD
ncbi:hypothetical protein CAT723_14300 [Corynebacterium ammoniagenes]|uniref:Uncharacterized protein n=1 Tax=Corynebacterium ammoniagenes TaxID=1697 RepID=A0AAV5G7H2_CORAM|nr:hypothetical protein CAT723_14300 [Corynebacterium ammoniagenes]